MAVKELRTHRAGVTLVTGATGFVGQRLINALRNENATIRVLTRNPQKIEEYWPEGSVMGLGVDWTEAGNLRTACSGVETIFHLASYTHAVDRNSLEEESRHREITVEGTRSLLSAAMEEGVRRFIFPSSVKAINEGGETCLDETAKTKPSTSYGRAKLEAERLVLAAGREHGIHVAVLRLPLVYGPGNKGNIPRMISAIDHGRFPPWPKVQNRRSMVHVDDVVRALMLAAENPEASGQVYLVTDGLTYSTRELYEAICGALDRPVPDWSIPTWVLRLAAKVGDAAQQLSGRAMPLTTSALDKLIGSAWYSSERITRALGYKPRHTLYDTLPLMIAEYREKAKPSNGADPLE